MRVRTPPSSAPPSSFRSAPAMKMPGLALSSVAMAALIYTIIEAPNDGWSSARSVAGGIQLTDDTD